MTLPTDQQLCEKLLELKDSARITEEMRVKRDRLEREFKFLTEQLEDGGPERALSMQLHDMMARRNMQVLIVNENVAVLRGSGVKIYEGLYQLAYQPKENNDTEQ